MKQDLANKLLRSGEISRRDFAAKTASSLLGVGLLGNSLTSKSFAAFEGSSKLKQAATATAKTMGNTAPTAVKESSILAPIVTSLGKVGGGGYSSGTLDAQRENNKLTSETNRILRDMSERMKPGGAAPVTAFG